MFVERELDQWYLGGTMAAFSGPEPYGWVERLIDAEDGELGPIFESAARAGR